MPPARPFTPALGMPVLTPVYDLAIRWLTREATWRGELVRQIDPGPADRILDVGCGTGSLALRLRKRAPVAELVGLDPDSDVLARAEHKSRAVGASIDWRRGFLDDAMSADLGQFSKVVSSLVLHQTPIDEKRRLLSVMHRVLQPSGVLFIADYGLQASSLMRLLFRNTVQRLDGVEDTQPNADGLLAGLIESVGFYRVRETFRLSTATGSISIYRAHRSEHPGSELPLRRDMA